MAPASLSWGAVCSLQGAALPVRWRCGKGSPCSDKYGSCHCYDHLEPSLVTFHCLQLLFFSSVSDNGGWRGRAGLVVVLQDSSAAQSKRSGIVKNGCRVIKTEITGIPTFMHFIRETINWKKAFVNCWSGYFPVHTGTARRGSFCFCPSYSPPAPCRVICLLPEVNCVLSFWRQITSGLSLSRVLPILCLQQPSCFKEF